MSLLQRIMKPQLGERIEVYKKGRLMIRGLVTVANEQLISITSKEMDILNFHPNELELALSSREIVIKKVG